MTNDLRIQDNAVYNGHDDLLGEFLDGQFVPSRLLLERPAKDHKAVDRFVRTRPAIALVRDANHGNELRIFTDKARSGGLGIDDLGLDQWYHCEKGCFVIPGSEAAFIAQCEAKGVRVLQ